MEVIDLASSESCQDMDSFLHPILQAHGRAYGLTSEEDVKQLLVKEMGMAGDLCLAPSAIIEAKALIHEGYRLVERELPQIGAIQPKICIFPRARPSLLPGPWSSLSAFVCGDTIYTFLYSGGEWRKVLSLNMIHEMNHLVRYRFSRPHDSFKDWLILEGMAGLFEQEFAPSDLFLPGWSASEEDIRRLLPQVEVFWESKDFMADAQRSHGWFYGSPENGVPRLFGYALGLYLVRTARRSSFQKLKWKDFIELPSDLFTLQ